jgi:SEC-C motif
MSAKAETEVLVEAGDIARLLIADEPPGDGGAEFLLDVLAAAGDDALKFLSGQVECHTARGGDVGPLLRLLRSNARGRYQKAAVALIAARAAEGAGDAAAARDLIHEALALRPDLEPALHDAAHYAAVRGDYAGADSYLKRAERPSGLRPGLTEVLTAAAAREVPRNSPCPCGSGRKFKACCQRGGVPPLAARAQLVYALLGSYAERAPGVEVIRPLVDRTGNVKQYAMFLLDLALFSGGLVERFLAARGHWLRPDERDLIGAWREVPLTAYEVLSVTRGTGVSLRALPDGEPIHLADRVFSTSVHRLGLLCGRVLHDGAGPRLLAVPVHVARDRRRALVGLLASGPSMEQVADFFVPEPPVQVRNSDGDAHHDCRVTYRVPGVRQVFDELAARLTRTGDDLIARHRPQSDGRVLHLGEIVRCGEDLTVTANSPARLAELEGILLDVAPGAVERGRRMDRTSPEPDPGGPEGRTIVFETYFYGGGPGINEDHVTERMGRDAEAAWLDNSGAIGDLTPRQAAASTDPAILTELRSLVDDIEAVFLAARRERRATTGLLDPDRLRRVLGLDTGSR